MKTLPDSHHCHRFPAELISHAAWLYHVFSLSFRDVEMMILAERGVIVSDGDGAGHVELSSARGMEQATDRKIEITLPDGTSIKVGHDVGLVTLRRVMTVLRQ